MIIEDSNFEERELGSDDECIELDEEILDALNRSLKGALWSCSRCLSTFVTRIRSIQTVYESNTFTSCPVCGSIDKESSFMSLERLLTEEEVSRANEIRSGVNEGLITIIPW